MVRVPALLIALVLAVALATAAFTLAFRLGDGRVLIVLLPVIAALSGFVAGRWASRPSPVPGATVGVIAIAARLGLGWGMGRGLLLFVRPDLAVLELLAAVAGGLAGALLARRASRTAHAKDIHALTGEWR